VFENDVSLKFYFHFVLKDGKVKETKAERDERIRAQRESIEQTSKLFMIF